MEKMDEVTLHMTSIQVDGGVLIKIKGKRTLVDFPTYNRIQKINKIKKRSFLKT